MVNQQPVIIQGGMGAGVSDWRLARAVSQLGQLGVVSGTALDSIMGRRLQDGDPAGHMRRAFAHFPFHRMAQRVWQKYYIDGGKSQRASYLAVPMHSLHPSRELVELCIVANFVEVFLAREGHGNPVGINYLEKIQLPHLPSIYGAMLAGVGYILMGAGIPLKIPGVLDLLAKHEPATYNLYVSGSAEGEDTMMRFSPRDFMECELPALTRPQFIAIVASNTLAATLLKKANGRIDGFVVEGPAAGGHNAPPRGKLEVNASGEPVYGERDHVDLDKIRALGLPFWLAGGFGTPHRLHEARSAGAAGIQVGTAFAYCDESGLCADYKLALLQKVATGTAKIFTDPLASPTGFPFKVAELEGTLSEPEIYAARPRVCDLGYLREAYRTAEGAVDFRCPGEPVTVYVSKGGKEQDTVGRKCLCNALVANIGHPQVRAAKHVEYGLVTSGDDLLGIGRFLTPASSSYTAADVVSTLLSA